MGKKVNQASRNISKPSENKKQLNSLIKVLRPKVYITDASKFKNLVQELTGNTSSPISFIPPFVQEPTIEPPMSMEMENMGYYENSLESSFASSEDSLPSSFTSLANSPQESYVPETTFNVLESSFASHQNVELASFRDIESWLLEMDSFPCNWEALDHDHNFAASLPEVSVYGFDYSDLL